MKRLDLIGQRFSRLLVTEFAGMDKNKQSQWNCLCDCGVEKVLLGYSLRNGGVKSCGCMLKDVGRTMGLAHRTHQMTSTLAYKSWNSMKNRCLNPNHNKYNYYGGIGVKVCDKWMTFEGFHEDMGDRPKGTSLDRINPFGDYEKDNCRWADKNTQLKNTRMNFVKELICRPL